MAIFNVTPETPFDIIPNGGDDALAARQIDRPAIVLRTMVEVIHGEGGWTSSDFSAETFDILVDGTLSGRLTRCLGGWCILNAEGALGRFAYRIWPDHAGDRTGETAVWPDGVLADIREALG